jgi:uncharacterized membrane protein YgcG
MKNLPAKLLYVFSPQFLSVYGMVAVTGALSSGLAYVMLGSKALSLAVLGLSAGIVLWVMKAGFVRGEALALSSRRAQLEEWARSAGSREEFDRRMELVEAAAATGSIGAMEQFAAEHGVKLTDSPFMSSDGLPLVNTDGTPMLGGGVDVLGRMYGSSGSLGGGDSFSSSSSSWSSFNHSNGGGGGSSHGGFL